VYKAYIGNSSYNTTEDTLRTLFAEYGEIESVEWLTG
jgi:RNA recognition motif-containing protein